MDIQDEKEQENYNSEEQGEEVKEREEGHAPKHPRWKHLRGDGISWCYR